MTEAGWSGRSVLLADAVTAELERRADPERAFAMAAYMKTEMPFFGVGTQERRAAVRSAVGRFPVATTDAYREAVLALWGRRHREEKYAAIDVARSSGALITAENLDLYERLIREGAWWDLVDPVAVKLVGGALRADPEAWDRVEGWINDPDRWLRRSVIICQLDHGLSTDAERLFGFCRHLAADRDVFIRKAIGWALRQYARSDADSVRAFLASSGLSPLSVREASRYL